MLLTLLDFLLSLHMGGTSHVCGWSAGRAQAAASPPGTPPLGGLYQPWVSPGSPDSVRFTYLLNRVGRERDGEVPVVVELF